MSRERQPLGWASPDAQAADADAPTARPGTTAVALTVGAGGWRGSASDAVAGESDPTLTLEAGRRYEVTWTNRDGEDHSLVLFDDDGERVARTPPAGKRGATRSVAFTAKPDLAAYACGVHPDEGGRIRVSDPVGASAAVHPSYGFAARSNAVGPPVDPDHEVRLRCADAEGRRYAFDPVAVAVDAGDTVQFRVDAPGGSVAAYHPALGRQRRVPEGVPPLSSPAIGRGGYWLYTFSTAGVYDLYCPPGEHHGAVVRVVVGDAADVDEGGSGAEPAPGAAAALADPGLDPARIVEVGRVSHEDLDPLTVTPDGRPPDATATLDGDAEVPSVDTDATGRATFRRDGDGLAYRVELQDVTGVTQVHLHRGPPDEPGPAVATLARYAAIDGDGDGDPRDAADAPLVAEGRMDDPEAVAAVLADPASFYVNAHTVDRPAGALRGQLAPTVARTDALSES